MSATADERLVVMLEARISEFEKRMRQAERTGSDSYRRMRRGSQSATRGMEQDMVRSTSRINQALATTSSKIGSFGKAFLGGFVCAAAFTAITPVSEYRNWIAAGSAKLLALGGAQRQDEAVQPQMNAGWSWWFTR